MTSQPYIKLNDGRSIPQLGLGVWQTPNEEASSVVRVAIDVGYRSVDTAAIYGNEVGVGEGIRAANVPREELFITTKLWNDRHAPDDARKAFDESLKKLGLSYVDLYLIHWPAPKQGRFVDAWRALVKLKDEGLARSIGVSNFNAEHLERIIGETGVTPSVNQIELHPRFQQSALRAAHQKLGIATESWSPLGQGKLLEDETLGVIARKHGKTPAQVIIRWHLDNGLIVIPKSVNPARIKQNFEALDFRLDQDDMATIAALDSADGRIGPDPLNLS